MPSCLPSLSHSPSNPSPLCSCIYLVVYASLLNLNFFSIFVQLFASAAASSSSFLPRHRVVFFRSLCCGKFFGALISWQDKNEKWNLTLLPGHLGRRLGPRLAENWSTSLAGNHSGGPIHTDTLRAEPKSFSTIQTLLIYSQLYLIL